MSPGRSRRRERRRVIGVSPVESRSLIYHGYDPATGEWAPVRKDEKPSAATLILSSIRQASTIDAASELAGLGQRTVYRWQDRGRQARVDLLDAHPDDDEPDRMKVPESERVFYDFAVELEKAEAHNEVVLVGSWNAAAREDWRAAQKLLATRHRKRWAEAPVGVELSGPGGAPLTIGSDLAMAKAIATNPEARQKATELLAMLVPAAPGGGGFDEDTDLTRSAAALDDDE